MLGKTAHTSISLFHNDVMLIWVILSTVSYDANVFDKLLQD